MNRPSNTALGVCVVALGVLVAVTTFVAVPAWRHSDERASEAGRLLARASQLELLTRERDALAVTVNSARAQAADVLRTIPLHADQGSLMRMLAVGVGSDMGTQTILAGEVIPATPKESGYQAIPVTVEMHASFARVMEILARAEGDRRLVRPIRIEITRSLDPTKPAKTAKETDNGFVDARIELDAVYGRAAVVSLEEEP